MRAKIRHKFQKLKIINRNKTLHASDRIDQVIFQAIPNGQNKIERKLNRDCLA